jgi:cell filamentation protein, protein adenylyltransferase
VLREVATLLEEGRAVGAKVRKDYMEVLGYSEAARSVYGQGIDPGDWTTGELITLTEVRTVHRVLMTKVWEVAPHPGATPQESPGRSVTWCAGVLCSSTHPGQDVVAG